MTPAAAALTVILSLARVSVQDKDIRPDLEIRARSSAVELRLYQDKEGRPDVRLSDAHFAAVQKRGAPKASASLQSGLSLGHQDWSSYWGATVKVTTSSTRGGWYDISGTIPFNGMGRKPLRASLICYLPPQSDDPRMEVGQQFVYVPVGTTVRVSDVNGNPISPDQLALKELRIIAITPSKVTFALEGTTTEVSCPNHADFLRLDAFQPLVEDDEVRSDRRAFIGKSFWKRSGVISAFVTAKGTTPATAADWFTFNTPVTITRVVRLWRPSQIVSEALGCSYDNMAGPLLVTLKGGSKGGFWSRGMTWPEHPSDLDIGQYTGGAFPPLIQIATDANGLRQVFSSVGPKGEIDNRPPKIQQAILKSRVVNGMTKQDVMWALHAPDFWEIGGDKWGYNMEAPFTYVVLFKRGLVVGTTVDGQLP